MLHVKFYKIQSNKSRGTTITKILEIAISLMSDIHVNVSLLFLIIYILHIYFLTISFSRSCDNTILKILGKTQLQYTFEKLYPQKLYQCHLLNILRIKYYKIPCNGSQDNIIIRIFEKVK